MKRIRLTLPGIECRGFLVRPGDLLRAIAGHRVAVPCPQAFYAPLGASVPECPPVPSSALERIFSAAFWSRSSTTPQPGQICVRTLKLFLTMPPQALQSCEVYWGATAITGMA